MSPIELSWTAKKLSSTLADVTPISSKSIKKYMSTKIPFFGGGGGVGAIGDRRLGTLARQTLVWDFACSVYTWFIYSLYIFEYHFICDRPGKRQEGFCVSFIYSIYLYFHLVHVYHTFCRVFSPKFATRKIPLLRNISGDGYCGYWGYCLLPCWGTAEILAQLSRRGQTCRVVTSFRIVIL